MSQQNGTVLKKSTGTNPTPGSSAPNSFLCCSWTNLVFLAVVLCLASWAVTMFQGGWFSQHRFSEDATARVILQAPTEAGEGEKHTYVSENLQMPIDSWSCVYQLTTARLLNLIRSNAYLREEENWRTAFSYGGWFVSLDPATDGFVFVVGNTWTEKEDQYDLAADVPTRTYKKARVEYKYMTWELPDGDRWLVCHFPNGYEADLQHIKEKVLTFSSRSPDEAQPRSNFV